MMRNIKRQMQDIWFCDFEEKLDGIDLVKVYGKPEKHRMTVSATSGVVQGFGAGFSLEYSRYITSYERNFKPTEGMMLFIDTVPDLDADGNLRMIEVEETDLDGTVVTDEDGNPVVHMEYTTAPDYMLQKIMDSQKGTVARYGIKKV